MHNVTCLSTPIKSGSHTARMFLMFSDQFFGCVNEASFIIDEEKPVDLIYSLMSGYVSKLDLVSMLTRKNKEEYLKRRNEYDKVTAATGMLFNMTGERILFMSHVKVGTTKCLLQNGCNVVTTIRDPYLSMLSIMANSKDDDPWTFNILNDYCNSVRDVLLDNRLAVIHIKSSGFEIQKDFELRSGIKLNESMIRFKDSKLVVNPTTPNYTKTVLGSMPYNSKYAELSSIKDQYIKTGHLRITEQIKPFKAMVDKTGVKHLYNKFIKANKWR